MLLRNLWKGNLYVDSNDRKLGVKIVIKSSTKVFYFLWIPGIWDGRFRGTLFQLFRLNI